MLFLWLRCDRRYPRNKGSWRMQAHSTVHGVHAWTARARRCIGLQGHHCSLSPCPLAPLSCRLGTRPSILSLFLRFSRPLPLLTHYLTILLSFELIELADATPPSMHDRAENKMGKSAHNSHRRTITPLARSLSPPLFTTISIQSLSLSLSLLSLSLLSLPPCTCHWRPF